MTALDAVATYLPERRVPIDELAGRLRLSSMDVRLFKRYHGLGQVGREPEGGVLDLLLAATAGLDALRGRENQVRYVLYARATPVVVPYPFNPLHDLCRTLGLDHAQAFTVTHQSCASGLLAIDLAGRLLAGHEGDTASEPLALVLAGEKAFTRDAELLPETSIFGEGASACLVSRQGSRDRMLSYACEVRGEYDGEHADVAARYQRDYQGHMATVILAAADRAGVDLADISLILPHNVNRVSWHQLCRRMGFPIDRVLLDNVPTSGHVYCADAFINYRTACERGLLRRGDRYLVGAAGAGRGATFSAMIFQH
jgi:3-oxoacyl-[acyl-carrier-protein] synthase III